MRPSIIALVLVVATSAFRATRRTNAALSTKRRSARLPPLRVGLFDAFAAAFKNEDFTREDVRCRARHVLVPSEERAAALLAELEGGAKFADVARRESTCASASKGGDLGEFAPGKMVAAFDAACFEGDPPPPVGSLLGPVQTQFGYHLIQITDRSQNNDQVTELLARND